MRREKKEFDLHRAGKIPEWDLCAPEERNLAQRVAAKTKGVVTPGNILTVGGGALFLGGLYEFSQGKKALGFGMMFAGGIADWVDGKAAAWSKTKSALGEALDASFDKIKMGAALLVLGTTEVVPVLPAVLVGAQNVANIALTGIAKSRGNEIHPDKVNKFNAAAQGFGLGALVLADVISPGIAQTTAEIIGYAGTVGGTAILGSQATKHLYDYAFNPQQPAEAA